MNSFAVVLVVATMSLFGLFTQTLGEVKNCHQCAETAVAARGKVPTSELTNATTQWYELKIKTKDTKPDAGKLRGCVKIANSSGVLGADTKHEPVDEKSCRVCKDADDCNNDAYGAPPTVAGNGTANVKLTDNGPLPFAGSAVLWALLSSLMVAKMFFHKTVIVVQS